MSAAVRAAPVTGLASVLVIDDSPDYRAELRRALEDAGHVVFLAASGEEGLWLAAHRRPGAVVVDGVLSGIDGATVIRRLRFDAALRDIPCLLLTAADERGAELRALEAGADAFVRKEDDVAVLLAKLDAVLRSVASPEPADQSASLLAPKRVLVVDDSATCAARTAEWLRGEGYDVVVASSGEEALDLLAAQPVDCILLDVVMPGWGGEETCRRIKSTLALRDIPLVMLTALEGREAMIRGLRAGADDYVSKSTELEVLHARMRAQLRRKQLEDENRHIREERVRVELAAVEARAGRVLAEARAALTLELERKNKELEAFSYSVSHDLRAPLRSIDSFSLLLLESSGSLLDAEGHDHLRRIRNASQRMGHLLHDLLELSRVGQASLRRRPIDLSEIAREVVVELRTADRERQIEILVPDGLLAHADPRLLRIVLDNLLGNAWKFTTRTEHPRIEFGVTPQNGAPTFFVGDNGAGFDMRQMSRLFTPFQRLHRTSDFPGTGIGLATIHRIIDRHDGRVWAEGKVGHGATFYFTIPPESESCASS